MNIIVLLANEFPYTELGLTEGTIMALPVIPKKR